MNYFDAIASIVEAETMANFDELLQDQGFRDLFKSLMYDDHLDVASKLIDYANNNLI